MWEKAAEDRRPLRPDRKKHRHGGFRPPARSGGEGNTLLFVQLILCVAALLVCAALRLWQPKWAGAVRAKYRQWALQTEEFAPERELVRFASVQLRGVRVRLDALLQPEAQTAAAMVLSAEEQTQAVPEGCSLRQPNLTRPVQPPLTAFEITSGYGWRSDPNTGETAFHSGVDLAAAEGTRIRPAMTGLVLKAARGKEYGNFLELLHGDGVVTLYAHMEYLFAREGEQIDADSILGTVGQTGNATGPHLHLELWQNNIRCNPAQLV